MSSLGVEDVVWKVSEAPASEVNRSVGAVFASPCVVDIVGTSVVAVTETSAVVDV